MNFMKAHENASCELRVSTRNTSNCGRPRIGAMLIETDRKTAIVVGRELGHGPIRQQARVERMNSMQRPATP
jgi:hypothetical protein